MGEEKGKGLSLWALVHLLPFSSGVFRGWGLEVIRALQGNPEQESFTITGSQAAEEDEISSRKHPHPPIHAFESQSGRRITTAHKHAVGLLEGGLDVPILLNSGTAVQLALANGM